MREVVILSGVRTAIGTFGGGLAGVAAPKLGATVIVAALERAGVAPDQVDEVVMGCVGQIGEDAYVSRHAAILAGLPVEVPAFTVNRLCGSGLQAIITAAQAIRAGDAELVVAGGVETMSRYPFYSREARFGLRLGSAQLEDALVRVLSDPLSGCHMGVTAENVARRWHVTRADQDAFALESQRRARAAIDAGRFAEQIVPVAVPGRRGETTPFAVDEHPRATSLEALAALRPVFQADGCVTAGNASGINDGAAAVVLASAERAGALGRRPRLRLVAGTVAGVEPDVMGIGPIPAVRHLLDRVGLALEAVDVVELNEAFAAQGLAVMRELGLDPARTNPNGGAIALGHPIGATGAILTVKLMHELERTGGRRGIVTLCIGGGQGIATLFERIGD